MEISVLARTRERTTVTMADAVDVMTIAPDSHLPGEEATAKALMMGAAATTTITVLAVDRDPLATEDVTRTITDDAALAPIVVPLPRPSLTFPADMV